ncbi:MAG: pyridoxamine 5'-phosphate oxidase family protein [Chloroflexota bacterium]
MDSPPILDFTNLSTLALATTGPDGEPHVAAVYFAIHPLPGAASQAVWRAYFFSEARSQHSQDLARDRRAAATLYPQCFTWQEIRGLQMRGAAYRVESGIDEWNAAWEQYRAKFPFVTHLKAILARNALYAFQPDWVRLVDNQRSFGFKQEWVSVAGMWHKAERQASRLPDQTGDHT